MNYLLFLLAHVVFTPEMLESNLKAYTEEEKVAIQKDKDVVRGVCFPDNPQSKIRPVYLATAGSPGSRKTTILERFMKNHSEYNDCIYIDPDPRTLKYMVNTYWSRSITPLIASEIGDYSAVIQQAYDKWRYGSIYISAHLLEEALENHYDVAHGTTLTGDAAPKLLKAVRDAGYEITLLLCNCDDQFRYEAIAYRNDVQRFYQSSPEDALKKGKLFPQRMPVYLAYADHLYFYWSDDLKTPERLAAVIENGTLTIQDAEAWKKFIQKYEADRMELNLVSWDELMNGYSLSQ